MKAPARPVQAASPPRARRTAARAKPSPTPATTSELASITPPATSELLVLPSGQILAHNVTPEVAALLAELDPNDPGMAARAAVSRRFPFSPQLQNHTVEAMNNHPTTREANRA